LDTQGLRAARRGSYPGSITGDVSAERITRYFRPEGGGYRVQPEVRALVRFSAHDVIRPLRQRGVDLVSCRNLLIYLLPEAQRRVLSNLHKSLRPGGWLLLGNSETVGESADLFSLVDSPHRLYQGKPSTDDRYR
jgi:two-component system CheB/CheR fusion protein